MPEYLLDGERMTNQKKLHKYMRKTLELPVFYKDDLNSLYECLTTYVKKDTKIILINREYMQSSLEAYGKTLVDVFKKADANNEKLTFKCD